MGIVVAQLKATLQRLLTIDTAMDGVGRSTCIQREHFGGTASRSQQYQLLLTREHRTNDSCGQRGLTRSC